MTLPLPPLPPSSLSPSPLPPSPSPLPAPPPSPSPRPLRDANGGWRCHSLCASLCSFASLRFMPIPHEQLGSLLYSSKPSASLLGSLSPSFEFHSKDRHILLQMIHPVFLLPQVGDSPWIYSVAIRINRVLLVSLCAETIKLVFEGDTI